MHLSTRSPHLKSSERLYDDEAVRDALTALLAMCISTAAVGLVLLMAFGVWLVMGGK